MIKTGNKRYDVTQGTATSTIQDAGLKMSEVDCDNTVNDSY